MYIFNKITVNPQLPKKIEKLSEISGNVWWSWNTEFLKLFKKIDIDLWEKIGKNPVKFLKLVDQERLEAIAEDPEFLKEYSKNVNVEIKGIASNRTYHVYDRLTKDCINLKPDVIIMLIGVNDAWENYGPENYPPLLRPMEPHMKEIYRRINAELPGTQVLYLMPFLIDAVEEKLPFHKMLNEFRELLKRLALENGAKVLDLFGGTGQLGIEALSRGAEKAVFVDSSRKSLDVVKKNIELCRFTSQAQTFLCDAAAFLRTTKEKFDIVILDPPYHKNLCISALELLGDAVDDDAVIICETQSDEELPENVGRFVIDRIYSYSSIKLTAYRVDN